MIFDIYVLYKLQRMPKMILSSFCTEKVIYKFLIMYVLLFLEIKMDSKATNDPMSTDIPQNEIVSDQMNISMAFKQIASNDPARYIELREAVSKAFEDISECIRYNITVLHHII